MDKDPNKIKVRIDRRSGFEATATGRLGVVIVALIAIAYLAVTLLAYGKWAGWW